MLSEFNYLLLSFNKISMLGHDRCQCFEGHHHLCRLSSEPRGKLLALQILSYQPPQRQRQSISHNGGIGVYFLRITWVYFFLLQMFLSFNLLLVAQLLPNDDGKQIRDLRHSSFIPMHRLGGIYERCLPKVLWGPRQRDRSQ